MARQGPVTKDTTTIALGLAQIRVGDSSSNIGTDSPVLTSTNSIGALANTKFSSAVDFFKLESGFPMLEDMLLPIREAASLECAFKEISPQNLAFAKGIDAVSGYTTVHSGDISLGAMSTPAYLRMEAFYTYPDGVNEMVILFPRSQVTSNMEIDLQAEDAVSVPITFEAKRADSEMSGGNVVWDNMPLGRILFRVAP